MGLQEFIVAVTMGRRGGQVSSRGWEIELILATTNPVLPHPRF